MTGAMVRTSAVVAERDDLHVAMADIATLVSDGERETLDEIRKRAEARSLYEKRAANRRLERHFATLRLIAEAGLGCLSFDDPEVVKRPGIRFSYRCLAAAFERGKLLELVGDSDALSANEVAWNSREAGFSYVPGKTFGRDGSVRWIEARKLAREAGISLETLPPDVAKRQQLRHQANAQAQRMNRLYRSQERYQRMKRQKALANAAKERSPGIDRAYGYLRQTLQAAHEAQAGLTDIERRDLDDVISSLYMAEDSLATLLRVVETHG